MELRGKVVLLAVVLPLCMAYTYAQNRQQLGYGQSGQKNGYQQGGLQNGYQQGGLQSGYQSGYQQGGQQSGYQQGGQQSGYQQNGQQSVKLQVGFYKSTCPLAESIVGEEVQKALANDIGLAADFLRMHFHDCFVRGCDGSILLDSIPGKPPAEKDSPINNPSLEGYDIIDNAKTRLEAACKGVVSCADIIAFAARDSVKISKGFRYDVPAGRRDGRVSLSNETFANLPPPSFDLGQLTQSFANKGLTQQEMVTLSGAHTIGVSHCTTISSRLHSFNATVSTDPSLDPALAGELKQKCPQGSTDANLVVDMDPPSPNVVDNSYYKNILANRGLFQSDQALISSNDTAVLVRFFSIFNDIFTLKFSAAMVKMGQIEVLTGTDGEVRSNCRVVN